MRSQSQIALADSTKFSQSIDRTLQLKIALASRNLMRHVNFGIPSGQAIARRMGVPALTSTQLDMLKPFDMDKSTPLWFYILKEAEVMEKGLSA